MLRVFWVHGCEPGRVSDGSRPALCQTLSIKCRSFISFIFLWPVYFGIPVPISLSFVCLCFSLLSLELGRCSSDLFSVQQTTYRIGNHVYYWVWLRPDRLMWRKQQQQQQQPKPLDTLPLEVDAQKVYRCVQIFLKQSLCTDGVLSSVIIIMHDMKLFQMYT